jgi:hypothetical protein
LTYPLYPAPEPNPVPESEVPPELEPTAGVPDVEPESKPSHKRLWITIGVTAVAVAVLASLTAGVFVFHSTADRYQRKANAETTRANGLDTQLSSTKEELATTAKDLSDTQDKLNSAQTDLSRSKGFANQAAQVGAKLNQCVQDTGTFLTRLQSFLAAFPYGYDPTLDEYASNVGAECADARASFYGLGIGAT